MGVPMEFEERGTPLPFRVFLNSFDIVKGVGGKDSI